jgi:chemotaxis response regulator CheB
VVNAGAADKVCPLAEMSTEIIRRVKASRLELSV